ncbi:MAG: DUF2924 domain-containing protein [Aestuariivirga sp.]|uniref:DUF2924 domain-containing protein n=1 Tax=Aestuariivirga sp. TaxID=2650926 RepID=UPI0038D248C4
MMRQFQRMTAAEHLAELGRILAAGLVRMKATKSSPLSADRSEGSVDLIWREEQSCNPQLTRRHDTMSDQVLARLATLKTTPTPKLKEQWRQLFEGEPPPFNRRYLESKLAYGGLKPETVRRLEKLGEELDGGSKAKRQTRADTRPISGTRLIRDYQGVEHCVTVRDDDFEYQGRPYKSLSVIARAITGIQWNGLAFFGLK